MRLRILSDLHLEFFDGNRELPEVEADVVVLAGDIHRKCEGLAWARHQFPDTPIIYVPGNHEFYGTCMPLLRDELALEAERLDIELLDNRAVTFNGVRFYGTTLWTDFALYAGDPTPILSLRRCATCPTLKSFKPRQGRHSHLRQASRCMLKRLLGSKKSCPSRLMALRWWLAIMPRYTTVSQANIWATRYPPRLPPICLI